MTEAIIDPSASCYPACYCLFFETGIEDYHWVDPDLFLFRARPRGAAVVG
jgi:hypothetical protein